MLTGSLLNHRRRRGSSGQGNVFFAAAGTDGVVGALTSGWSHPGPEGLTHDQETRRVSCVASCPKEVNAAVIDPSSNTFLSTNQVEEEEQQQQQQQQPQNQRRSGVTAPAMVGVTSDPSQASAGAAAAAAFPAAARERVAMKPFHLAPLTQVDSFHEKSEVDKILDQLTLDDEKLKKIMALMNGEMEKGLDPKTQAEADIKMFPTYVRAIPDGTEEGDFLALDLGGTNFRVLWVSIPHTADREETDLVELLDDSRSPPSMDDNTPAYAEIKMKSRIFVIPTQIMRGPGVDLFDHIVKCLAMFMDKEGLLGRSLPLGFTFSFPLKQEGLAKGRLVTWTKGFSCDGVVGEDVVQMFHEAIHRYSASKRAKGGLEKVKCVAIVNDTTGTLMACAHKSHQCAAGLIFGTGTNACYVEKLKNVHTWDGDRDFPDEVLINTEWGAFGNAGALDFILTDFDEDVDRNSVNPGKQIYEKMISGMYMGEIARLVLCRLYSLGMLFSSCRSPTAAQPDIFKGLSSPTGGIPTLNLNPIPEVLEWDKRGTFFTKYISEIEGDRSDDYVVTKQVLDECGIRNVSMRECRVVKRICETVSTRAAYLASAAIAVLLNRMQRDHVTIGIDGSLYRFHPQFHNLMVDKIPDLSSYPFNLMLSEDGSGKGAALIAAVAQRMVNEV